MTDDRILATLRELIGALDRRVSHVERPGEIRIVRDAQMLRRQAVARIEEITRAGWDARVYDPDLVDAIMTDDGGPTRQWEGNASAMQRSEMTSALSPVSRFAQ